MSKGSELRPYLELNSEEKIARLSRHALHHVIKSLSYIDDQSKRLSSEFETVDCQRHLEAAIRFLKYIREVQEKHLAEVGK